MKEKLNIGLPEKAREAVAAVLARLLADEHVLYIKTRGFHWNITGRAFGTLHKLFEEQYDALAESIDEIAERIRQLGMPAPGSMKALLKLAALKENEAALGEWEMVAALRDDHEAVIRSLRAGIAVAAKNGDDGNNDFLVGLLEQHEKAAWFLRAHLEG
ncbi:MAG: DNA starvation/stationary phase protection protein [Opitutaceae bacterium]|jgi:starvation-inducible DNA-binding protein|nr:DNA starvation/stationary phase protection protein [Opitutaceae bacterium]